MSGLLTPGTPRAGRAFGDAALAAAMLRVELAWLRALSAAGAIEPADVDAITEALVGWEVDLRELAEATEAAGNPVVPFVRSLRASIADARLAGLVHRGLTSQDVLDTAMVLLAQSALTRVAADLDRATTDLARLAADHRDDVMVGRTLGQHAVPITFGLKAAQWLAGALDAREQITTVLGALPVQCGGAAGTLALVGELTATPVAVGTAFAEELDLTWPGLPWHTRRGPITRIGDALVTAADALGVIGTDVAFLSRPEVAEVREGAVDGRGGSSTMPHKRNPVLSVLVRSAALQAPLLGAQLHLAGAQAVDERPDGAWHSEWPAFRRLLELAVTVASQAAELVAGVEVDTAVMAARADAAAADLLAERGAPGAPADYLGAAGDFVDVVLARIAAGGGHRG